MGVINGLFMDKIEPIIKKLSLGDSLTVEESRLAFNVIGDFDRDGYFFTALTMGLMSKKPTLNELYGFCLDRQDRIGSINVGVDRSKIIDLSGGGGDVIKTINVSTAAAIVLAAGGVYVAKQCAKAMTGFMGSSDVLEEIGIPIPTDKAETDSIKEFLEKNGLVFYNYASLSPKRFINFLNWRKKMIRIGLKYFIPHHIASFAYSPIAMDNRIYGVANPNHMTLLGELLQKLGYKKIMVVHGIDGLDEVSNIGKTKIIEIVDGKKKEYEVSPADFGVKKAAIKDIAVRNRKQAFQDFTRVLFGEDDDAKRDLVAVNAAVGFYLTGKVKNLKEGTQLAIKLIENGKTANKLEKTMISFS